MNINTESMISITEANQNFSKVARMVDEQGSVVVLKNNAPRYLIIDFSKAEKMQTANNEDVESISRRLISENLTAYKELAK